jgi:hypothetical protein
MAGRGKPRNHLISVRGVPVVVPCGNVRKEGVNDERSMGHCRKMS